VPSTIRAWDFSVAHNLRCVTLQHDREKPDRSMNLNQIVKRSLQVISQEISGETVFLDLERECYFGLDTVGTRIWQLIETSSDLLSIFNTLLEEYEVEESRLRGDLETLINDVRDRGLISLEDVL
jgi:hypothetical protein